ncbi:MAG: hypothetical protein L6413_10485 [Coriobacteriia bacterium]|nr:hypothetical protein [Coriobacteriia bacterium]
MHHSEPNAAKYRGRLRPNSDTKMGGVHVAQHGRERRQGFEFDKDPHRSNVAGMNDVVDMCLSEDIKGAGIDRAVRIRDDSHNKGVRI